MIELKNISKTFINHKHETVVGLNNINLSIQAGEIFGIAGYSGAGKSTLLRMINLLEQPSSGDLWVNQQKINPNDSQQVKQLRRKTGMIFQHFNLLKSKTVAENIALPLTLSSEYSSQKIRQRVQELIQQVGLLDQQHKYPAQLSGGQKQRVGIARALANSPSILLCDEATSALDPSTTHEILNLLSEINEKTGITIILITHEMDVIKRICDRVAILNQGNLIEFGEVRDIFLKPQHQITQLMLKNDAFDISNQTQIPNHFKNSKIIKLTAIGDDTYAPILSQIAKHLDVDYAFLHGKIEKIKNMPYSQLTIALSGQGIESALSILTAKKLDIQILN